MSELRPDLDALVNWIQPGSHVLDLGCGDGTLLKHLHEHKNVTGYGLEISPSRVRACVQNGVNVLQMDAAACLPEFDTHSFDYVIMSQTLQAMKHPDSLLDELLRVGKQGIVTFPNFGHWRARTQLSLGGKMPVSETLPSAWFETRNIHLCTIKDFEILCREKGIHIQARSIVDARHKGSLGRKILPNLLGEIALYQLEKRT